MSANAESDNLFRGWFGRLLAGAPFVDKKLLSEAPHADYNTAAGIEKLRLTQLLLVPLVFYVEGEHVLRIEGIVGLSMLTGAAIAVSVLLRYIEGGLVREIVTLGAVHRGRLSSIMEYGGIASRSLVAVAAALFLTATVALAFYAADITHRHHRDWEMANADKLKAANAEFDKTLEAKKTYLTKLEEILSVTPNVRPTANEIRRLEKRIVDHRAAISEREVARTTLLFKRDCELHGRGNDCLGASTAIGDGNNYKTINTLIDEHDSQLALLRRELGEYETALVSAIDARDAISKTRTDLYDDIALAKTDLGTAETGRAQFVAERVRYSPPGVAEQFAVLLAILIDYPVNAFVAASWAAWMLGLDLAVLSAGFALRASEYGIRFRRRLAHADYEAVIEAQIEKIDGASRVAQAKSRADQADLDDRMKVIVMNSRNHTMQETAAEHRVAAE